MTLVVWIILSFYAIVVLGWWARHILISLTRPLGLIVDNDNAPLPNRVSVIVPARNERDRIRPCIESLLKDNPSVHELIVIDDRSDDGTAEFVKSLAPDDPRLIVRRVDQLREGWQGKANACHFGARYATGEWLLFTDADCRFFPEGLDAAVRYAERHNVDWLTLWLRADHRSFAENLAIPLCGAIILYWFPPFRANARTSSLAYGNGQFILIRRQAHGRINGHTAARETLIEDVPLAEYAKKCGLRMRTALGPDVATVRMYTSYTEVRDGWTRIFMGALRKPWKLAGSIISILGGSLLPSIGAPTAAIYALINGIPTDPQIRATMLLLTLHFVAVYSASFRLWGLCRCDRRYLLAYPLSCILVIAFLARALWWQITDHAVNWRS